jgi:hypothetical protein
MICGNTDGRCAPTSQPSGTPEGAGDTGHDPATGDGCADALEDGAVLTVVPGAVHAAAMITAPRSADVNERVMAEA